MESLSGVRRRWSLGETGKFPGPKTIGTGKDFRQKAGTNQSSGKIAGPKLVGSGKAMKAKPGFVGEAVDPAEIRRIDDYLHELIGEAGRYWQHDEFVMEKVRKAVAEAKRIDPNYIPWFERKPVWDPPRR